MCTGGRSWPPRCLRAAGGRGACDGNGDGDGQRRANVFSLGLDGDGQRREAASSEDATGSRELSVQWHAR